MNRESHKNNIIEFGRVIGQEIERRGPELLELAERTCRENPWFTREAVWRAMDSIKNAWLGADRLGEWLDRYSCPVAEPRTVGIVMAGNLPLVGFHDLLSVLASGHNVQAKASSKDPYLIPYLVNVALEAVTSFADRIAFVPKLKKFDAIIATGSDNSARYFDYYFGKYPHIIRKNRTSVAVLSGEETEEQLDGLADDITLYFGMGCRSVTKLYLPEDYDLNRILKPVGKRQELMLHSKYRNNFEYNYSIYALNRDEVLTNDAILLKRDESLHSPLSVVYYEYYGDPAEVRDKLESRKDEIQCVVTEMDIAGWDGTAFGKSQEPALDDYADRVDTMDFLMNL